MGNLTFLAGMENMPKQKITLIILGHSSNLFSVKRIGNWKSKLFQIANIQTIENLPESKVDDGYLDQKFETDQLSDLIQCPPETDIAIGIIAYSFVDNFIIHRLGAKRVVISLHGINDLLSRDSISIDNFVLKHIYEVLALKLLLGDIDNDEVHSIVHKDTRGCLFDFDGDKQDVIYNTEKPKLCEACKSEFKRRQIDANIMGDFERELKRINKPMVQRIELFIKKYPLSSLLTTGIVAIVLNVIASAIWETIRHLLNQH